MLGYVVKRLLLIPPKIFVISLVVFLVLNLAGSPPQDNNAESATPGGANAAWLAFRKQFDLDLPILVNTRYLTTAEEVEGWVRDAAAVATTSEAAVARVRAQERLDDWGWELVPHLVPLLGTELGPAAAARLSVAAQRPLVREGELPEDERRARNGAIANANAEVRAWTIPADATPERAAATVAAWNGWWAANAASFDRSGAEKLRMTFLDTRFARYWGKLLRLDLGESTLTRRPVLEEIQTRIPRSLALALCSLALAYGLALPIGVYSAARPDTAVDRVLTVTLFLMFSLPTFFTGTVLLRLFSTGADRTFPSIGLFSADADQFTALELTGDLLWHLALPVATYASVSLAALSRYARSGVIDVIRADYVRTARAKGLHEVVVIVKHAARNGMIPILTLLGSLLATLVGGSVIIETVFGIPGMGLYLYESIANRDYQPVMGILLFSSLLTLLGVFLADLLYALADPRIAYE